MGNHPIFESDFDCLTEGAMTIGERIGFVTLATTDSYAAGALVLARSLRQANTVAELVCLVSSSISEGTRARLASEFDDVVVVDVINSNNDAMLTCLPSGASRIRLRSSISSAVRNPGLPRILQRESSPSSGSSGGVCTSQTARRIQSRIIFRRKIQAPIHMIAQL